jgi:hypothetical protein
MKKTSEDILKILNDDNVNQGLESLISTHADHEHLETTMSKAYENFLYIKELVQKSSDLGIFEELSIKRRVPILNNLKILESHSSNVNKAIEVIETVRDIIEATSLERKLIQDWDIKGDLVQLSKLKSSYTRFNNKFKETKKNLSFIDDRKDELEDILINASGHLQTLKSNNEDASKELKAIETKNIDAQSLTEKLKEKQKEVESLKLNIDTFSENIEEYKAQIEKIETRAKDVVSLDEKIKSLISEAETALQLTSTEGISRAFSAQHLKASKWFNYWAWIIAATVFIITAISLTIWAISGEGINNPDSFGSIAGRIVAVGIAVSGAAFCARQYVKQKNIAEDYAYKAVLSKSIIAFADEIASSDDDDGSQVGSYMNKVLDEIHKDPLRSRKEVSDKVLLSKENIESIAKLINAAKGN